MLGNPYIMNKRIMKDIVGNLDIGIACVALMVLIVLTFLGVVMRYVFSNPYVWLEEVQIALFLWVAFLGSSAAFRFKAHVEIGMLVERFPQRLQILLSLFIYAVVSFSLLYLGLKSSDMVAMFIRTNKSTSVLSIPSALIYGVIPVSAALMWINYTVPFLTGLKESFGRMKGEGV